MTVDSFHLIYCAQKHNWDCGLACCAMIMKWFDMDSSWLYDHELAQLEVPLWTIDLLLLLEEIGIAVQLRTKAIGVQLHHASLPWYCRTLSAEQDRVNQQFAKAQAKGLDISQEPLSLHELRGLAGRSDCMVVLLVNGISLRGEHEHEPDSDRALSYEGHFVVLTGFDASTDSFTFLDPAAAAAAGPQTISAAALETCRTHPGTDEDALLCWRRAR